MKFKDHFSGHAADYAKFRPSYPPELFAYLATLAPDRVCAWDCATGNGQAAVALAEHFERVIATDASAEQIANAEKHPRVEYRVATAEASAIETTAVSLITVAQALHWFEAGNFFAEARRVLQANGVLTAWSYNLFRVAPGIDRLVETFYRETVGPYWDFERRLVETGYSTVEFPFSKVAAPEFQMEAKWTLQHVLGYLRTWSATKGFIAAKGFDPVTELARDLERLWGDPNELVAVKWPLSVVIRQNT